MILTNNRDTLGAPSNIAALDGCVNEISVVGLDGKGNSITDGGSWAFIGCPLGNQFQLFESIQTIYNF